MQTQDDILLFSDFIQKRGAMPLLLMPWILVIIVVVSSFRELLLARLLQESKPITLDTFMQLYQSGHNIYYMNSFLHGTALEEEMKQNPEEAKMWKYISKTQKPLELGIGIGSLINNAIDCVKWGRCAIITADNISRRLYGPLNQFVPLALSSEKRAQHLYSFSIRREFKHSKGALQM